MSSRASSRARLQHADRRTGPAARGVKARLEHLVDVLHALLAHLRAARLRHFVGEDAVQPGAGPRASVERLRPLQEDQDGGVRRILGPLCGESRGPCRPQQARQRLADHLIKRRGVPAANAGRPLR